MRRRARIGPPDYNNNGSRLILPQNLLTNRALAGDFLAIHQRIALSPNTSSQFIQAQRPRHSEIALSLGTSLQFTTESRVRLLLPRRTHARSLAALRGPARCPSWPRSLPLMAPRGFAPRGPAPLSPCSLPSGAPRVLAPCGPARYPSSGRTCQGGEAATATTTTTAFFLPPFPYYFLLASLSLLVPVSILFLF